MKDKGDLGYQRIQLRPQQSLTFSYPYTVEFPTATQIKRNFLTALSSFIKQSGSQVQVKTFLPLPNQLFLLANGNVIKIYRYWQSQDQELHCQMHTQLQLSYYIKDIKASPAPKSLKEKGFFLIVQDSNSLYLQLLYYQSMNKRLVRIKSQKISSAINCWNFIENKELFVWCQDMKIYHYDIRQTGLKFIQSVDTCINMSKQLKINPQEKKSKSRSKSKDNRNDLSNGNAKPTKENEFVVHFCSILGNRGKEQDSIIALFYVLYNQETNSMKIKSKQILYPLENQYPDNSGWLRQAYSEFPKLKVLPQTFEIISSNTASPEILKALNIIQIDDAYLVHFQFQIIVIQKKFQKYYTMDNVYKKSKQIIVDLAHNANLVSCITGNILQLNEIQINDNKVHSNLIDFIDLKSEYEQVKEDHQAGLVQINKLTNLIAQEKFNENETNEQSNNPYEHYPQIMKNSKLYSMWVTNNEQSEKNICFLFEVPRLNQSPTYEFFITKHTSLIKKLTKLGHKTRDSDQLQSIQKLGQNLGLDESEFYFNMWKTSQQGSEQILIYLLKCKNYKKIITELRGFIRKKSFPITKLLKVMQKLESITLQIVKQKLTEEFLIDYFHVIFVHRKFQVYESNYKIDEKEFVETLQISLYDLIKKIINNTLFPEVKKPSLWMMEPKEQPKLNVIQVLDLFKLSLLEDYHNFLRQILKQYPDNIIDVIDRFPELLPDYPFLKYQIVKKNSLIDAIQTIHSRKQKQFFSSIKQEDILAEPNFLQNTLKELYPFYSTSVISKHFELTLKKPDMFNKKFYFHSVIESDFQLYEQKIEKITAVNLYIVVLQCLIMAAHTKQEESEIEKLCRIMNRHYGIDKNVLDDLQVAASLYELMIKYSIVNHEEVDLKSVYQSPIQKWIALFFLGNKQQKDLIFSQFMEIFAEKQSFIQAIRKFISSEHCSKIQLSFLVDLITHTSEQFQKQNQKIINVIIDGFCSRVQISDTPDSNHFMDRIRSIQLGPELLIKVDKIEKMKFCRKIFGIFYMQDILMKDLMNNTEEMLEQMLENFFMNRIKQSKIPISQKNYIDIDCNNIPSMFELLNYLRENIFFNLSAEKLVILYCKKLLQWQSFPQIEKLLYEDHFFEDEDLSLKKIVPKIQLQILQQIYNDENTYYDQQTVEYIERILKLQKLDNNNMVVIQERAKIALADIFKKLGHHKKLMEVNEMCNEWEELQEEVNREAAYGEIMCRTVMTKIIDQYEEYLDANSLEEIYKYFMIASTCKQNPQTKTDEFYHYCTKLAGNLLEIGRLREASQIICIANERYEMNYWLMAQCLLSSLVYIYVDKKQKLSCAHNQSLRDESVNQQYTHNRKDSASSKPLFNLFGGNFGGNFGTPVKAKQKFNQSVSSQWMEQQADSLTIVKRYIDYFVMNWVDKDEDAMKQVFSCFFHDTLNLEEEYTFQFELHPQICFKQHRHKMTTILLWNIVDNICQAQGINRTQMIYAYFFMRMGLAQPHVGFALIDYISYNQAVLFTVLSKLKQKCDTSDQLYFIDYSIIFKIYLDAITELLTTLHQQDQLDQTNQIRDKSELASARTEEFPSHRRSKPNLAVVRDLVRKGLYKTDPIAAIINKMSSLTLEAVRNMKKREVHYTSLIDVRKFQLTKEIRLKKKMSKIHQSLNSQPTEREHNKSMGQKIAMMSFDQFKKMKNKVKNNKQLSQRLGPDLNITERVIVEEIFSQMEMEPGSLDTKNKKYIPGLEEMILTSLKEMQEEKQLQEEIKSQSVVEEVKIIQSNPIKQYIKDEDIFIEAINLQNYAPINKWSPDAILIETAKVYHKDEIKFQKVIKMFNQLCVGNQNKVDILWIAQPEKNNVNNEILKKVFTIEYLRQDFPASYDQFEEKVFNLMYPHLDTISAEQISHLADYMKDISKIQYKKIINWVNILFILAMTKLSESLEPTQIKIRRLNQLATLLPKIKDYQKIKSIFEAPNNEELLSHLKIKIQQIQSPLNTSVNSSINGNMNLH